MMKTVRVLALVTVAMLMAGCGYLDGDEAAGESSEKKQAPDRQEKAVKVKEGLSKEEEEKLSDRLDELEKRVESQEEKGDASSAGQNTQGDEAEQPRAEDQVRAAAEGYYQAVAVRNWAYTYDHLDTETQSAYTEEEWFAKNDYLADTGAVTYTIQSVEVDSSASAALADVSINDDSLDWFVTEEIVGTETYERDIAANSGLSVSAATNAFHAQTSIEVYENGELVAQDSDPNGLALVNY